MCNKFIDEKNNNKIRLSISNRTTSATNAKTTKGNMFRLRISRKKETIMI